MDEQRQVIQQHYDLHAQEQQHITTEQALKQRKEGPAAPLKEFHNEIKRRLIYRFAYQADALIDYACGRGGDIHKWHAAKVGFVKGLDISGAEIQEAQRRFGELRTNRAGCKLQAEFEQITTLSEQLHQEQRQYDAATCMFAIHYFFDKEESLDHLLETIAANLKPGGYFIGCVPDGKRVKAHLQASKGLYEAPHLRLKAMSDPPYGVFGSKYIMEIPDTVVEGHQGFTEGSEEYMVFEKVLLARAAHHGLYPVVDYGDPAVDKLFAEGDAGKPLKHFAPNYPKSTDRSLSIASEIYMAFVLQKVGSPGEAAAPPVPPPESKGGGFGGGGGRGGPSGGRGGFGGRGGGGGRGLGGDDKMSSLTWKLPYASQSLQQITPPSVYHNLKEQVLKQRREAGRWIIYPPPLPLFSGPVQYNQEGHPVYLRLPNGNYVHTYEQELDYWRRLEGQQQQQYYDPPPPQQQQQQHHHHQHHQQQQQQPPPAAAAQGPNGIYPPPPQNEQQQQQGGLSHPGAPGAAGGRGTRGGRGGGRKGAAAAGGDAAGGDGAGDPPGRGRGRGRGQGSRGGRTAGAKRDRLAGDESHDAAEGEASGAEGEADQPPAAKKQALEPPPPAAAAAEASAAEAAEPAAAADAAGAADAGCHSMQHEAASVDGEGAPGASAAAAAVEGVGGVSRALSADAKLAKVIAADPMSYKEREQPAPLSQEFLAALIQQAPPYAQE